MKSRRWIGSAFVAFPIVINIPFAILASRFDYPDILRAPPAQVLERFATGGSSLVLTWYAFALCMLLGLFAMTALPWVEGVGNRMRLGVATTFGAIACVFQLMGLIRWTFAVPMLAKVYTDPATSDAARSAAATAFLVLNQYAGVALGEHLGQLFTAVWMALLSANMFQAPQFRPWLGWLGYAGSLLWLLGLSEGFATVLPFDPGILATVPPTAFLVMGVWMMAMGIALCREPIA